MPRWSKLLLTALLGVVALAAVVWLELPRIASAIASRVAGRQVEIGALSLWPGRWIGMELRDASLANLQGGTRPKMATVSHVTGQIQLWPLLHGTVVARSVRIEDADLLLEKVDGQPNWRNGPEREPQPGGGRAGFPTLLGLVIDGTLTDRTTSGAALVVKLDGVRLEAGSASAPAHLTGPGSYQGLPVTLDFKLGSFDQLHDAATPFPTDLTLTARDTVLHFDGTMTDPLNVDGANGHLGLTAPTPGVLERVAGIDPAPAPALRIEGAFMHDGSLWRMQQAHGALGNAALENGMLQLTEGSAQTKTPDRVQLDLRFGQVDADRLLASFGKGGGEAGFVPAAAPDPELSATLQASRLSYGSIKIANPKLDATSGPGVLKLESASFGALGGDVRMNGAMRAENGGKTGALSASATATGLNVSDLGQALGSSQIPLRGRMDLHATAHGTANALRQLDGGIVATMGNGSVSARLVELASTDVAGLFRSSGTMTKLSCLLAVADIHGGVARLGPVRLRSAQGTIVAHGTVNLPRDALDVVVAGEDSTTGVLALDIPVHVTGSLGDPSVGLAGSGKGGAAGPLPNLPAALRTAAQGSDCAR